MTGTDDIRARIPHRGLVLLVDRVSEVWPGDRLTAWKTLSADALALLGGLPADPDHAFPVGLLVESWAQAAVLLVCWERPNPRVTSGSVALATGARDVALLAPVRVGDVLEHRVEVIRLLDGAAVLRGSALVGGREVLTVGQFTMALRPVRALRPGTTEEG